MILLRDFFCQHKNYINNVFCRTNAYTSRLFGGVTLKDIINTNRDWRFQKIKPKIQKMRNQRKGGEIQKYAYKEKKML